MDATLHALAGLLIQAIPTILLFIFLCVYLKYLFFKPVARILEERRKQTEGVRELAQRAFEAADQKSSEFERALQLARAQIGQENEELRRQWAAEQAETIARVRAETEQQVENAKKQVAEEIVNAKAEMDISVDRLSSQIVESLVKTESRLVKPRVYYLALCAGLLFFMATGALHAQPAAEQTQSLQDGALQWKLINFGIFAVALGYALVKYSPAFFNARSADIQKAIKDATGLKMDADFRYSEIDKKMANLAGEVEKLRAQSKTEMDREYERVRRQTEDEIAHIQRAAAAEFDGLRAEGTLQVRRHTADLALGLAEKRLRDRFASTDSPELLEEFLHLVEQGKN